MYELLVVELVETKLVDLEFLDQDEGSFEEDDELADEDGLT